MAAHAPPFYCPYCGDEDIRPFGEKHGDWRCGACRRVWTLRYVGIARPDPAQADPAQAEAAQAEAAQADPAQAEAGQPDSASAGMSAPVGGLDKA